MKEKILSQITTECPWRDTLYWYDCLDSTNNKAKELAKAGAPAGTVVIAGMQTAGRGRMGRSFSSPGKLGVYLSVILRPDCTPDKLMHLTCAAGVAGCKAIEKATGLCPQIKWANDLVWNRKKLGGILTELGFGLTSGTVDYAIVGIGINCMQAPGDFPAELQNIATSLLQVTNAPCPPDLLAAALVEALWEMDGQLLNRKTEQMARYRKLCITTGQDVLVVQGEQKQYAKALSVEDDGGLLVQYADDSQAVVSFGEVSVRGMYGYL